MSSTWEATMALRSFWAAPWMPSSVRAWAKQDGGGGAVEVKHTVRLSFHEFRHPNRHICHLSANPTRHSHLQHLFSTMYMAAEAHVTYTVCIFIQTYINTSNYLMLYYFVSFKLSLSIPRHNDTPSSLIYTNTKCLCWAILDKVREFVLPIDSYETRTYHSGGKTIL